MILGAIFETCCCLTARVLVFRLVSGDSDRYDSNCGFYDLYENTWDSYIYGTDDDWDPYSSYNSMFTDEMESAAYSVFGEGATDEETVAVCDYYHDGYYDPYY